MKQKHLKYLRIAVAAIMFALFFAVALGVRQLDPVLVTQFGPGLLHLASVLFLDVLGAVIVIAVVSLAISVGVIVRLLLAILPLAPSS